MELKRLDIFLLKTLYLVAGGIIVMQVLGQDSLTSLLFTLTFPLTVLLWLRTVRKTVTATDLLVIAAAVLAGVNVLVSAGISGGGLSFSYLQKAIIFIMSLLFLQTAYRMRIDEAMVRFINLVVDLLTIFLIAMYFLQNPQMHLFGGRVSVYLTFRFSNPNLTALFLTSLFMLELYRLFTPEKWFRKILHITMAAFLAWFVLESRSRNGLLVLVMFTAGCAWLVLRSRRGLRIGGGWAALIAAFPALFVAGYMALITSRWVQELFSFLVGEGKGLDSRVEVWQPALERLVSSPLIGSYYDIYHETGGAQLHNTHLEIACSYGLPVLILVCVLLGKYLHNHGRRYGDKASFTYILGFACAILLGMGEAAAFSGGLGIYIFIGTFLLMANKDELRDDTQ